MPPMGDAEALAFARRIVDLATDKKASDVVLIGVGELTTLADYLVICSGGSERQLGAIADGIVEGLKADGTLPLGREGLPGAHWVLLDFGAVIVHVFARPSATTTAWRSSGPMRRRSSECSSRSRGRLPRLPRSLRTCARASRASTRPAV
jgi:ribosome-associated protein